MSLANFIEVEAQKVLNAIALKSRNEECMDNIHALELLTNYEILSVKFLNKVKPLYATKESCILEHDGVYYVNSNFNCSAEPVTTERVIAFNMTENSNSVNVNEASVDEIDKEIIRLKRTYEGLHAIRTTKCIAPALDYFTCDCKNYLTYGVLCEHILIALNHSQHYKLANLMEALDQPKKCGRKRKHSPALSKE